MNTLSNRTLAEQFADLNAQIPEVLAAQHADLKAKADGLADEFTAGAPETIADDETEKAMTDLGARINGFLQLCEGQRKNAKEEPLKSTKVVDDFFKVLTVIAAANLALLRARVNDYKNAKRLAEQKRQQEEQARAREAERQQMAAREEAIRAERERMEAEERARHETDPEAKREAQEAAEAAGHTRKAAEEEARQRAREAQEAAAAAKAPATMVKAESGAKSGQSGTWRAKNLDRGVMDLNELKLFFTIADIQKAADAYARTYKDTKPLAGCQIEQEFNTTFRGA